MWLDLSRIPVGRNDGYDESSFDPTSRSDFFCKPVNKEVNYILALGSSGEPQAHYKRVCLVFRCPGDILLHWKAVFIDGGIEIKRNIAQLYVCRARGCP